MNNDFRLKIGTLNHIKIRRLIGRHGADAFIGLIRIWEYAASIESEDGNLHGLSSADISMIALIDDDEFGNNLAHLGLLDREEFGFKIHNWRRHYPWCCESKKRKL